MRLSGRNNTEFQISIVGYQFPKTKHERYDADWLDIDIRVTDRRGNWSSIEPILLTWEVARLADWLEEITADDPVRTGLSFVEPNLRFELADIGLEHHTLRVYFNQESRPPWDPSRFGFIGGDVAWIELQSTTDELRKTAIDLRTQLQHFPVRVGTK